MRTKIPSIPALDIKFHVKVLLIPELVSIVIIDTPCNYRPVNFSSDLLSGSKKKEKKSMYVVSGTHITASPNLGPNDIACLIRCYYFS